MAEKANATCSICGNGYYKCVSCKEKMSVEPWKIHCCSSEHFKIFQIIRGFNNGVYTKDEARERLQNVDLSDLNNLRDYIKKSIREIMKENKNVEKVVEPSVEENTEIADPAVVKVENDLISEAQASSYIGRRKKSFNKEDSE